MAAGSDAIEGTVGWAGTSPAKGHELAAEFRLLASPAPTLPTPITPVVGDEPALGPTDLEADRNQSRDVFLG
jgi:hypothetical protein